MMTQFANYGLVMLILWNIAKSLWTNDGGKGIKDILKKAVFAGIAIQASWFFMAMMLDLSTVLVYSVGSTPLQAINNSPANRPILTNHGTMNLDDVIKMGGGENGRKSRNRYSYENNKRDPLYPDMTAGNNNFLSCVTEEYKLNEKTRNQFVTTFQAGKTTTTINTKYCVIWPNAIVRLDRSQGDGAEGERTIDLEWDIFSWLLNKGNAALVSMGGLMLHNIIDQSKGMVGPLYTLYGSLLNFSSLNTSIDNKASTAQVIEFLIKGFIWLMLLIPLFGLVLVLMARVGVMRVAIGFSPLLVLLRITQWSDSSSKLSDTGKFIVDRQQIGNIKQLMLLIFQPVITIFALSVGLVFLSAIQWTIGDGANKGISDMFGLSTETNKETMTIKWDASMPTITMSKFSADSASSIFFDYFSWIITNIFGIFIVRNILIMSLKANKITETIAKQVGDVGSKYLWSRPFIPIGNKMVSRDGLMKGKETVMSEIADAPAFQDKTFEKNIAPQIDKVKELYGADKDWFNTKVSALTESKNMEEIQKTWSNYAASDKFKYGTFDQIVSKWNREKYFNSIGMSWTNSMDAVFSNPTELIKYQNKTGTDWDKLYKHKYGWEDKDKDLTKTAKELVYNAATAWQTPTTLGDNNYYKDGIGKDAIGYFAADSQTFTINSTTKFGKTAGDVIAQLNDLKVTESQKGDAIKLIDANNKAGDMYLEIEWENPTRKSGKKPETATPPQ